MVKQLFLYIVLLLPAQFAVAQTVPGPNPGDTGSVIFLYRGSTVTYPTVRAADGKVWLRKNLGALKVADSATDANAYGDLFQWGRWDDGHQLRSSAAVYTSTLGANNPSGLGGGTPDFYRSGTVPGSGGVVAAEWWSGGSASDTWTGGAPSAGNGKDPCAAIGSDWHLPDTAAWGAVIRAEGITSPATAMSSHLKLPLAGTRTTFGSLSNVGNYGEYWSSVPHYSNAATAHFLYITSNVNNTTAGPRSYGLSCRCIQGCIHPSAVPPYGPDTVCAGSIHTYYVPHAPGSVSCAWHLPPGWTGVASGDSIIVTAGSGSGIMTIGAAAVGACGDTGAVSVLQVYVPPFAPAVITVHGDTLGTMNAAQYTSWQWYRNGSPIPGATASTYVVTANDTFSVKVTDRYGCTDLSEPYAVTNVGISSTGSDGYTVRIYPNPAYDLLYTDISFPAYITISSMEGKTVLHREAGRQLYLGGLPAGMYIVRITDHGGRLVRIARLTLRPQQ